MQEDYKELMSLREQGPEHRREFQHNDEIVCPNCGSDNLERLQESMEDPDRGRCADCGQIFTVRYLVIWKRLGNNRRI